MHSLWWHVCPWPCCHLCLHSPWGLAWSLYMKARGLGCRSDSKNFALLLPSVLDWGLRWNRQWWQWQKWCQGGWWVPSSWGHRWPRSAACGTWWHALPCSQVPALLWVERKCPLEWTGAWDHWDGNTEGWSRYINTARCGWCHPLDHAWSPGQAFSGACLGWWLWHACVDWPWGLLWGMVCWWRWCSRWYGQLDL